MRSCGGWKPPAARARWCRRRAKTNPLRFRRAPRHCRLRPRPRCPRARRPAERRVVASTLESFHKSLDKGELAPVYLIAAEEPLLLQEACDALRARARALGFA